MAVTSSTTDKHPSRLGQTARINIDLSSSPHHTPSSTMVLVLVIGDLHIPTLTHDLPAKFKKLLVSRNGESVEAQGRSCSDRMDTNDKLGKLSI